MRFLFRNRPVFILFLMTFIAFSFFFHRFRFWNVNSRVALTYAMVDDHSFQINKYVNHPYYETQDRAYYKGHYYSDKIIGLSLLGAPVYWAMKKAFALIGKDPKPDFSRYGLTVCIVSLSSALLMVVLCHFLLFGGQSPGLSCLVVLFFAFGTMLFPFSSLFYAYLPSLFFLITAWYLMLKKRADAYWSKCQAWLLGGLVGMALLCDYTIAVPAVLISAHFLFMLERKRLIFPYALGVCVPLSLFAAYNWVCFDNPFSLPYSHLESPEFRQGMSQGLMGVHRFQWYVLYLITLHPYRGVFFYSPFLLLAFIGIARGIGRGFSRSLEDATVGSNQTGISKRDACIIAWIILACVVYYLILNASYYMWWGGGTLLARHLIPMLPFMAIAFAWFPRRLSSLLITLGVLSVVLMFPQSVVEPHYLQTAYTNEDLYTPWETVQRTGHGFSPPFLTHSLPAFLRGCVSMNPFNRSIYATDGKGWTLLPLLALETVFLVLLWRSIRKGNVKGKEENTL